MDYRSDELGMTLVGSLVEAPSVELERSYQEAVLIPTAVWKSLKTPASSSAVKSVVKLGWTCQSQ